MFDAAVLRDDLLRDEGFRAVVYDDATGKPIVPGTLVAGHPTVGIGRALDVNPLSREEAMFLLDSDIAKHSKELFAALPWAASLDEPRCRALVNMAFNLGVPGLLKFHGTLDALRGGRWADASAYALDSAWAKQVGARALRIAAIFATGTV